jgi:hypothetical protein
MARLRLVLDREFPPYSFVPGHWPHPERHEDGHSYGAEEPQDVTPLNPKEWERNAWYRWGIDLFNHGYYWEAHEAWEYVWHRTGHQGTTSEFLKGLIKLTAAGVKVRAGQPSSVRVHCERAGAHFRNVAADFKGDRYAGLSLLTLIRFAEETAAEAESFAGNPALPVEVVFDYTHQPL